MITSPVSVRVAGKGLEFPLKTKIADGLNEALCKDKFDIFRRLIGLEPPL